MNKYQRTKDDIIARGYSVEDVENLAKGLVLINDLELAQSMLKTLVEISSPLPWRHDRDFGALVLQRYSMEAVSREVSRVMLQQAVEKCHLVR
jgi:hypothetical protein